MLKIDFANGLLTLVSEHVKKPRRVDCSQSTACTTCNTIPHDPSAYFGERRRARIKGGDPAMSQRMVGDGDFKSQGIPPD